MATPNFWVNTVYIGDNLPVLRQMNSEVFDGVYIDPPFNKRREHIGPYSKKQGRSVYNDVWRPSDVKHEWVERMRDEHPRLHAAMQAAALAHSPAQWSFEVNLMIRVLEIHRVLKRNGVLWLHCDDTTADYTRVCLDAVFGQSHRINTFYWKRHNSNNATTKRAGRIVDTIFCYAKGNKWTWHPEKGHAMTETEQAAYKKDADGRWFKGQCLTAPDTRDNSPRRFNWRGTTPGRNRSWAHSLEELEKMWADGLIIKTRDGRPNQAGLKCYIDDPATAVTKIQTLWTDRPRIGNNAKGRPKYPTAKPIGLVERIIELSSNEGDLWLDAYCGCGTTIVAALRTERFVVGIDESRSVQKIIADRLHDSALIWEDKVRVENPEFSRSDDGLAASARMAENFELTPKPDAELGATSLRALKESQYEELQGFCQGFKLASGERVRCRHSPTHMSIRNFEHDHVWPKSRGGRTVPENMQVICGPCNRAKGTALSLADLKEVN